VSFANTGAIGPTLASHRFDMVPGTNSTRVLFMERREDFASRRFLLVGATLPAAILATAPSVAAVRVLGLGLAFCDRTRRSWHRAAAPRSGMVLMIDQSGILDLRLMPRRIGWHEIEMVFSGQSRSAAESSISALRWQTSHSRARAGSHAFGAILQQAYGVPAITISMLLLDGRSPTCWQSSRAIARISCRPRTMRRATAHRDPSSSGRCQA